MRDDYDYNKMVQRIVQNKEVLLCLKYFYLDEIGEWRFQEELEERCLSEGISEDTAYAMYFASRLPGEKCFEKIMRNMGLKK